MKRILTISSILLLLLVTLLGISALLLPRYLDPNKFKGRISQYVYAKTDQVLVINGNMQWSFFPWIGLKAHDLTYYNPPNFTPKTFLSAKEMDIKVKLIPLVTGKIEVGNVTLDHAVLNLIKNTSGQYNWSALTKNEHPQEVHDQNSTNTAVSNMTIQSLKIKNSKLNWYDQSKKSHTTMSDLNITSKDIQFGQPFPLNIDFNLLDNHNVKNVAVELQTDLNVSHDYKKYNLDNIDVKAEYFTSPKNIAIKGQGNISADMQKQLLDTKLNIGSGDLNLKLNLAGNISKAVNLRGTISTDEFNLKDLLADLGKPMTTKNSKSLSSVSLLSNIAINDNGVELTRMHAKVDQNNLFGNLAILNQSKTYRFNLTTNNIDIDDFIGDDQSSKEKQPSAATDSKPKSQPWGLIGTIKIAQLKADKLKLSDVTASLNTKNNITRIAPLHASFYKGVIDGTVTIDKHIPTKTVTYIKQSAKDVDIKELLHEFSDADKLSGTTNLTTDLTSVTNDQSSFLSALNGKIQLTLTKGSLQGVDVIYQLSRAHAFIKHLSNHGLSDSKQTEFASLSATGLVNNGVINSDDLTLTSDYLKVSGKGSTNLVNKEIHYRLNALAQPKLAAVNDQVGKEITIYQVPIKVSGKLTKPSVNLDFAELTKNFVVKEIKKPLTDHLEKNINQIKDNLKSTVKDKLKSLTPTSLLGKLNLSSNKEAAKSEDAQTQTATDP